MTWTFNAGDPATEVEAVARAGDEESQPYIVNTPKVAVPGWAGSASDWSGSSGVSYAATLDWPVSLETTRTLSTISLLSGLWGITGSASSELNVNAASAGGQVAGDLSTSASLSLAGTTYSLELSGDNQTELSCEDLATSGDATAQLPRARWQKTLNPITAIPGVSAAACSLHRILCELVNGVGITASAEVGLSGTAGYTGEGDEIAWDSGALQGDIGAKIRASAVPPPLDSLAALSVEGGGSGCIGFQLAPDDFLDTLGGEVHVAATLGFFGFSANPSHEWPFGDSCGAKAAALGGGDPGWVPADGQLAMAVRPDLAAAVWTELPAGQSRPSGDILVRLWDGSTWGAEVALTDDVASDLAPAAAFDETGRLVVVYQRNVEPLPTDLSQLDAYGDAYELHWAAVDPATAQVVDGGALTANAANDFGPFLRAGADGSLHLFWQRAAGAELVGTDADPVAIVTRSLAGGQWTDEEVAVGGLEGVFGWSPAVLSGDEMLIGLIRDTDGDLGTDEDRDLFLVTRTVGAWDLPVRVTSDLLVDESPQAAYDDAGEPVLLWRSDGEVLQLRGDLTGPPQPAFGSADPATDDGIGGQLALGRLAGGPSGLAVIWPEGTQLELATDRPGGMTGGWSSPARPFPDPTAQSVHSLHTTGTALTVGYATRAFEADGASLEATITPQIGEFPFATIFADGFESGGLAAWSAAVP